VHGCAPCANACKGAGGRAHRHWNAKPVPPASALCCSKPAAAQQNGPPASIQLSCLRASNSSVRGKKRKTLQVHASSHPRASSNKSPSECRRTMPRMSECPYCCPLKFIPQSLDPGADSCTFPGVLPSSAGAKYQQGDKCVRTCHTHTVARLPVGRLGSCLARTQRYMLPACSPR